MTGNSLSPAAAPLRPAVARARRPRMRALLSLACALAICADPARAQTPDAPIDRHALVSRHDPHLSALDPWAPFSVGNGQFCFTADVTGLQTFPDYYRANGIPLETQARWSWHEDPNPRHYQLSDANRAYTAHGRTVGYPTNLNADATLWLRENPHTMPLPQLGLAYTHADGKPLAPADIRHIDQKLDLWHGVLTSRYTIDGQAVTVTTLSGPAHDTLVVRIASPLVASGKLAVDFALPRGYDLKVTANPPLDWSHPESHSTRIVRQSAHALTLEHSRDGAQYSVQLASGAPLAISHPAPHSFRIGAAGGAVLELTVTYAPGTAPTAKAAPAADVVADNAAHWPAFWQSGAAVDFSGSTDTRAAELERRVVLSEYLTAIQLGGDFPAQESGLTTSTWYGKHHTEMVWWHAAHFALWGRDAYLARTLQWYQKTLPVAREIARSRGLTGARWPKMTGPGGRDSPGGNPLIVWNQPHVIALSELLYRNTPTPATLARYRALVSDSAEAMASMLHWDEAGQRYVLGPPLWIAQEIYDPATSMNPAYELSYWARGLEIAQEWRERLGLPRNPDWENKRTHLSALPQKDGKYVALESMPDTWDNVASRHDHPSFLMALGQLPGDGVERAVMRRTLDAVLAHWDWDTKIWGWDYPMIAMTAARLNAPQQAVDILLKSDGPSNAYTASGHNPNRGLPVYLPGNGALLAAVAMMAGGWDGAPPGNAPGFPRDGSWTVRAEGFHRLP